VVIVIDEGHADATFFAANADRLGDVVKLAVSFVAQQVNAIAHADRKIGMAIVVEIAGGTAQTAAPQIEARRHREIREAPTAEIVEQSARSFSRRAHQEEIRL